MAEIVDPRAQELLEQRTRAYKLCFGTPAGKEVLKDLMRFCRANESAFDMDVRVHALLEGRREVWLRITEHFALEIEALALRYRAVTIMQPAENEK
jgi:hypothetical protein